MNKKKTEIRNRYIFRRVKILKYSFVILCCLVLSPCAILGQENELFFTPSTKEKFHISHYTNENALKQIIINGILLDGSNFLWLMTPSGCVRFDGSQFSYFNTGKGDKSRAKLISKSYKFKDTYYVKFADGSIGKITDGAYHSLSQNEQKKFHVLSLLLLEKTSNNLLVNTIFEKEVKVLRGFYPIDSIQLYIHEL